MVFDDLSEDLRSRIANKPFGVSARFAAELVKVANPGKALGALLDEGLGVKESLKQGMSLPTRAVPPKPKTVLIKSGQKRVAEMVNRSGALTIKFSDPNLAASLMAEIEALIRAKG